MKGETAMKNKRRLTNLIMICLISLLVLLAGCGVPAPPPTEPPPTTEPPPSTEPLPTEPPHEQPPPPEFEIDTEGYSCEDIEPIEDEVQVASNGIFIDGQLLLRGLYRRSETP
jgi:hypothetical protein